MVFLSEQNIILSEQNAKLIEQFNLLTVQINELNQTIESLQEALLQKNSDLSSIHLSIDMIPDMENSLLNITLYPLSNMRSQNALANIIHQVNTTNTVYPGTSLVMRFKIATLTTAPNQDV
jgi:uncharacterized FAD-dependent dehydrogenase